MCSPISMAVVTPLSAACRAVLASHVLSWASWAAAWATDRQGRPLFAAVPGGETQREYAVRFGVNVAMYALTGNYKGDQVHVESILERMKR